MFFSFHLVNKGTSLSRHYLLKAPVPLLQCKIILPRYFRFTLFLCSGHPVQIAGAVDGFIIPHGNLFHKMLRNDMLFQSVEPGEVACRFATLLQATQELGGDVVIFVPRLDKPIELLPSRVAYLLS